MKRPHHHSSLKILTWKRLWIDLSPGELPKSSNCESVELISEDFDTSSLFSVMIDVPKFLALISDSSRKHKLIKEDPRSKGANPEGLMNISIDLSQKNATFVYNVVSTLLKQATDPKLKLRYTLCLENFKDAINNLEKLPGLLKSKDYYSLSAHASAAIGDPSTCDNRFLEPPAETPQLKDASDKLRGLIDVILVLVNFL
ncbi:hypothetical protein HAX54_053408 [Datura stramonium]|uniref:Pectinesterase inhibitor domain-containing protein n=1 Tax=Datura stramonium TaxID=4076 RepID=A0ABS8T198_DATST|nr:hypothetical protein [Datura stramonium]